MKETEVRDGVLDCIKSVLKWDVTLMEEEKDFKKDYGADTFELFLVHSEIKKHFNLSGSEEQLKEYRTIAALTKAVMKLKCTEKRDS